ncbi:MAG TPA: C-GCAxxG-C-C family (seleno)protein, partial [Anaeromyxobacteraceae bacterium]|nr:C-GCAxxG-C-C family (seleno)protein [Anaeromyxobacteraceae bacterium]
GCCHGSFSALIGHLSTTVGAPFSLLPPSFGKFGAGGIDSYGSLCGSLLGAELVINMIASDATARKNMIWELMRWYETYAFPSYVPITVDPLESTTLSFTGGTPTMTPVAPGSHLCHASVSKWCATNAVSAGSGDKKARCARLTADVAGKAVAMLNAYLAASPRAYGTIGATDPNGKCDGCHTSASTVATTGPSVASDMTCVTCHPIANLPGTHPTVTP